MAVEIISGMIVPILCGAASGAVVALLGYAKSSTAESFELSKALQTVAVGAVVGGIGGHYGWSYEQAYEWASSMGVITIVEYLKKFIWRRLDQYIYAKGS